VKFRNCKLFAACSCKISSISIANLIGSPWDGSPTDVADLFINHIDTAFAKTYMSAIGDLSVGLMNHKATFPL